MSSGNMSGGGMEGQICLSDLDCSEFELCYLSTRHWDTGDDNICFCYNWFGYRGPNCDELGPTGYFAVTCACFCLCLGLLALFCGCSAVYNSTKQVRGTYMKASHPEPVEESTMDHNLGSRSEQLSISQSAGHLYANASEASMNGRSSARRPINTSKRTKTKMKQKKPRVCNLLTFSSLLLTVSAMVYLAWQSVSITMSFTPHNLVTVDDKLSPGGVAKRHKLEDSGEQPLLLLLGLGLILSALNLSFFMFRTFRKAKRLVANSDDEDSVFAYKKTIAAIVVFWVILFVAVGNLAQDLFTDAFMLLVLTCLYLSERYLSSIYIVLTNQKPYVPFSACIGKYPAQLLQMIFCFWNKKYHPESEHILESSSPNDHPDSEKNALKATDSNAHWLYPFLVKIVTVRRRILVATIFCCIGSPMYFYAVTVTNWRDWSPIDGISIPVAGIQMLAIGLGLFLLSMVSFARQLASANSGDTSFFTV